MIKWVLIFVFFQVSCAQTDLTKNLQREAALIEDQLASYEVKKFYNDNYEEAVEAIGYFENKKIKKLTIIYAGETGKKVSEFYFDYSENIFLEKDIEFHYNRPRYYNKVIAEEYNDTVYFDPKKTHIEKHQYFIGKDSLLVWTDSLGNNNQIDKIVQIEVRYNLSEVKRMLKSLKSKE